MLFSSATPVTHLARLTGLSVLAPDMWRKAKDESEGKTASPHEPFTPDEITEEIFFSVSNDFEIAIRTNSEFPDLIGELAVDCGIEDFIERFRQGITLDAAGLRKGT